MRSLEEQADSLFHYIAVSGRRGRSADEIIAWGRAPEYRKAIAMLEDGGMVYHANHLFIGIRYYANRRPRA